MASITTWVRLEPRSRDADLLAGVEARIHDPLWLLARQWQLGELTGADAGSAVVAQARGDAAIIEAVRGDGAWTALDSAPLQAVAIAPAPGDAGASLARRARAGQHLLRVLAADGIAPGDLAARFPLVANPAEQLDDDDARFARSVSRRLPDGDAVAAALAPLLVDVDASVPPELGLPASATASCRRWLAWRSATTRTSSSPTWRPEELGHRYAIRAGGDLVAAAAHTSSELHWSDVDLTNPDGQATTRVRDDVIGTALPSRVWYRGMPARRYWELEDADVHWPSLDAGPGDIGRLLFIEFGLTFGEHWLTIPLAVPAGSIASITSLVVTDTFGDRWLVESAAEIDARRGTPGWRFLELSSDEPQPRPLVYLPASSAALDGPTLAAIEWARDDVADVTWAVERTRLGADGRPRTVEPATPPPPRTSTTQLSYRLGTFIDPAAHPYRPHLADDGAVLALAAIPGTTGTPRTDLPARIRAHATPSYPLRVATRALVMRGVDGTYHAVARRTLTNAPPSKPPALVFDSLEPTP